MNSSAFSSSGMSLANMSSPTGKYLGLRIAAGSVAAVGLKIFKQPSCVIIVDLLDIRRT